MLVALGFDLTSYPGMIYHSTLLAKPLKLQHFSIENDQKDAPSARVANVHGNHSPVLAPPLPPPRKPHPICTRH